MTLVSRVLKTDNQSAHPTETDQSNRTRIIYRVSVFFLVYLMKLRIDTDTLFNKWVQVLPLYIQGGKVILVLYSPIKP